MGKTHKHYIFIHIDLSFYYQSQLACVHLSPEPPILILISLPKPSIFFFPQFIKALLRIIITLLRLYLVLLIFQVLYKY